MGLHYFVWKCLQHGYACETSYLPVCEKGQMKKEMFLQNWKIASVRHAVQ